MVDISQKKKSNREAMAQAFIKLEQNTLDLIFSDNIPKGNVLTGAKIAGIQAAKQTKHLIPLCHSITLTWIDISITQKENGLYILAIIKAADSTGVEMEALTAVSITALTIYDMCKAVDKHMQISEIRLLKKTGGKSDFSSSG
jgi:molybdenum cofactor biosynthesis protein MoaC